MVVVELFELLLLLLPLELLLLLLLHNIRLGDVVAVRLQLLLPIVVADVAACTVVKLPLMATAEFAAAESLCAI